MGVSFMRAWQPHNIFGFCVFATQSLAPVWSVVVWANCRKRPAMAGQVRVPMYAILRTLEILEGDPNVI
jgi:hypothetical protein